MTAPRLHPVMQAERRTPGAKCFACDKTVLLPVHLVDTRDAQAVFVGPECFKRIEAAGESGYQPPKGGPRLWVLS